MIAGILLGWFWKFYGRFFWSVRFGHMTLIGLVVAIIVLGLLAYLVQVLPIPQPFKTIAWVLLLIVLVLWIAGWIPLGLPVR